jgi:hypothetical protein
MELLVIALVVVAVLIAAVSIGAGRQGQLGGGEAPPALGPSEYRAPPTADRVPNFRRRPREKHFTKHVPTPPPAKKELGQKPQRNGGKVTPKELIIDFDLLCPVMARTRRVCPCQTCRDLRKKFGV